MMIQYNLNVKTKGRGLVEITHQVEKFVKESTLITGLCHVFLHHTSASLILGENADPRVQADLEAFIQRLIPDGDPLYTHRDEGPDDMPAHIRSVLTQSFLLVPISNHRLALGTWQGIYLWEHRLHAHQRNMTITLNGIR